jgi:hypothetical protein
VKLVAATAAAKIHPHELPAGIKIVANPDGTFSMAEEINTCPGKLATPTVRMVKNNDGSFTVLPPPPPPLLIATALNQSQLEMKTDGTATVAAPPQGFHLVTAPGGATYLENSSDGTRVAVTRQRDGKLGLSAAALGQVMASSAAAGASTGGQAGGGLIEAAVYNHLYKGGGLPPGVKVEANSDGTINVIMPPTKEGTSPVISRLDLRSLGGQKIQRTGLSAGEQASLEQLVAAAGGAAGLEAAAASGQLPPGIQLVKLSDGTQSVVKNGVPTGAVLGLQANGKMSLQQPANQILPLFGGGPMGTRLVSGLDLSMQQL